MMITLKEMEREFEGDTLVSLDMKAMGTFNDSEFEGESYGIFSREQNLFHGHIVIPDDAKIGNGVLYASHCSIACTSCCVDAKPVLGAQNFLSGVFGEKYEVDSDYTVVQDPERVVGFAKMHTDASIDRSDPKHVRITGTVEIEADGIDTDPDTGKIMEKSAGYVELLRNIGPGEIEGLIGYPYLPVRAKGEHWPKAHVYNVRRYKYDTNRQFPSAQVRPYHLKNLKATRESGRRVFDLLSDAYFLPLSGAMGTAEQLDRVAV